MSEWNWGPGGAYARIAAGLVGTPQPNVGSEGYIARRERLEAEKARADAAAMEEIRAIAAKLLEAGKPEPQRRYKLEGYRREFLRGRQPVYKEIDPLWGPIGDFLWSVVFRSKDGDSEHLMNNVSTGVTGSGDVIPMNPHIPGIPTPIYKSTQYEEVAAAFRMFAADHGVDLGGQSDQE